MRNTRDLLLLDTSVLLGGGWWYWRKLDTDIWSRTFARHECTPRPPVHDPVGLGVPVGEQDEGEEEGEAEGGRVLVPEDVGGVEAEGGHLEDHLRSRLLEEKKRDKKKNCYWAFLGCSTNALQEERICTWALLCVQFVIQVHVLTSFTGHVPCPRYASHHVCTGQSTPN